MLYLQTTQKLHVKPTVNLNLILTSFHLAHISRFLLDLKNFEEALTALANAEYLNCAMK
jgi:hypothetical protein